MTPEAGVRASREHLRGGSPVDRVTMPAVPYPMSPIEVAWGWLPGGEIVATPEEHRPAASALEALEDAIRPALLRPPCVVLFSGGRDSSLVLAAALRVARREGIDEPVALTQRFPGVLEAREDEWQEEVVRYLGVKHWERLELTDELDILGPRATASLLRHGVVWPPLAHTHWVEIERARGGSLVDGEGGDEVLGAGRLAPLRDLVRGRRWSRQVIRLTALSVSPRAIRRAALGRDTRRQLALGWLTPGPRRELERAIAADGAAEPADWRRAVTRQARLRGVHLAMAGMAALAAEEGASMFHPLLDHRVTAALARAGGIFGFADRTSAMRELFGDLLPDSLLSRTTKARFNHVVFHDHCREFVSGWTGAGADPDLVDAEALAAHWHQPQVHALTFALLQGCWLAERGPREQSGSSIGVLARGTDR
ncbi:MAG TPA: asparagine synthase C-terminal domain-containing protein [Acidimicrobiales bacterium]|nr:asparagine synthase C-terminal domain-containing protein [Acidimicrobiales bacterium]